MPNKLCLSLCDSRFSPPNHEMMAYFDDLDLS